MNINNNEEEVAMAAYNEACQKAHENVTEDTNTRVKNTLTFKQCLMILLIFSVAQYMTTTTYGRWHSGHWFWQHASIQKTLIDQNDTYKSENIVLREGLRNAAEKTEWLFYSHNIHIALIEDDPSKITNIAWEWIKKTCSAKRMKGLMRIMNDGNHPNLAEWAAGKYISRQELEKKLVAAEVREKVLLDERASFFNLVKDIATQ